VKFTCLLAASGVGASLFLSGCGQKVQADARLEEPPPAVVEHASDANVFKADHPEQFPLVTAGTYDAAPQLNVTGAVAADISRSIPVVSLAAGRIVEIHARLGDQVTKGQLLLKVQSQDLSQAFSDHRQALADEVLAKAQLDRAKLLYEKGATAQKDLEVAQDAAEKAKITVETTLDHLKILGADPNNKTALVNIYAPASGVITDQQVTTSAGTLGLASPNPFTISDLSHVWIICDVYENDLDFVRVGQYADIHLNAYPKLALKARVNNIAPGLDPNIRTAKVRLEVENPGMLRIGMFVNATFHGMNKEVHATLPATAILHLHDRDWVYAPIDSGRFRRIEVVGGNMLPSNLQEVVSGLNPGRQVIQNALVLQATVEQ
jgi:cobalt-zinc-cadmium efflux system membrane fusion protein